MSCFASLNVWCAPLLLLALLAFSAYMWGLVLIPYVMLSPNYYSRGWRITIRFLTSLIIPLAAVVVYVTLRDNSTRIPNPHLNYVLATAVYTLLGLGPALAFHKVISWIEKKWPENK